ncbi:hypothetical protein COHA_003517 [Chlorella ohadii]|uniref:Uncharacterized protein n=1 Tax=Chlorella ohadii TaxID=2649997 RepID=A0AAD5DUQ6_9CHLO|nr:hypothetical protein COHA_003517 [Chlorella ohadii]
MRKQQPPWQAPSLQLTRCKLRRFTPEAARKCLEGRPLVMIGDSLTRYQYIALIYFLEFGRWPAPLRGAAGHPSPVIASEWGPWSQFYQGTTTMFAGHQQCRCFRQDAFNAPEDRFYRNGNLSMTFYRWLGYPITPLAGHWGFPPFSNATQCQPGACSADPDWQLPIQDGIREVIAKLKPHTLVLNAGLWRRNRTDWPTELYDSIFEAGIKAVAPQGGQCVWKTTTLAQAGDLKVGRDRDAAAVAAAQRHGWLVTDAWGATHAAKMQLGDGIYIDPAHYKGFVYTELNQLLLNTICPAHN